MQDILKRIAVYSHLVVSRQRIADHKKISNTRRRRWEKLSADEQRKYLDEHPNSIYQRLGVTKKSKIGRGSILKHETLVTEEPTTEKEEPTPTEETNTTEESLKDGDMDESPVEDSNKTTDLTDKELDTANENIDDFDNPNDSAPGSDLRKKLGEGIRESGVSMLKDYMDEDELSKLSRDLEKLRLQNSILEEKKRTEDINRDKESTPEQTTSKSGITKRVATTFGLILLASAIGVGLYAINPYLGLQVGSYMMENFSSIHSNIMNRMDNTTVSSIDSTDETNIKNFVDTIAEIAVSGNLPEDFSNVCRLAIGIEEKEA